MELAALCTILDENPNDEDDILLALALGGFFDDILTDNVSHIDHRRFDRFNLDNFSEAECKHFFRFQKYDIPRLCKALLIPDQVVTKTGTSATGEEAMAITLRRLAYPNRLVDSIRYFGRAKEELSMIFNTTLNIIYEQHAHRLSSFEQPWLSRDQIEIFCDAISEKGSPMSNIFGFIDGTVRPICRPTQHQRMCYNGHKRVHAVKFQSVVVPNGLIANLHGPMEGKRHDCALLRESNILQNMAEADNLVKLDGTQMALYGDPAYVMRPTLYRPFGGAHLNEQEQEFNCRMSSVRESVEWGFGKIAQEFAFLDFKKNLKLFLQPVAKCYLVGAILTNAHTCLYGNVISSFFNTEPPTLEEYFTG